MSSTQKPLAGVEWPATDASGDRSTTVTNQKVFAAATAALDKDAAGRMLAASGWRFTYDKHVVAHVKASLQSPDAPIRAATDGLHELHNTFEFFRDGKMRPMSDAMNAFHGKCETGVLEGNAKAPAAKFELPYHGKTLRGDEIVRQCRSWERRGVMEPDAARAIINVANTDSDALRNLFDDTVFVMLGAGAAMGPFLTLMAMGANVVALDIAVPAVWERLLRVAESSRGRFTFPLKKPQAECGPTPKDWAQQAGVDLIKDAPEIANWVASLYPTKRLVLGSYVYLDGPLFVKVSVACDAIIAKVLQLRPNAVIAMLGTPTDVYVVPKEARDAARANHSLSNWRNWPLLLPRMLGAFLPGKPLRPNFGRPVTSKDKQDFYLCEAITVPQGPNYILSKRMQQWRCVLARSQGHTVSFNVAPATATLSVLKNRTFAWAYDGMGFFDAVEIFNQETSNAVMTALLLNDLTDPSSAANPKTPLRNPLELFSKSAIHGGAWRMAYTFQSIGAVSVIIHFLKVLKLPLLGGLLVLLWLLLR